MIIGGSKKEVIQNIKYCTENNLLNNKVEVNDPNISEEILKKKLEKFYKIRKNKFSFKTKGLLANIIVSKQEKSMDKFITIKGFQNLEKIKDGAIVTSNHFNPFENLSIRKVIKNYYNKNLITVVQDTNIAMKGLIGYLFNYMDTLPVSKSIDYITNTFKPKLKDLLDNGNYVLIYPEEEMWFNYKKPRPCKRGAYQFAAEFNKPIISCFVEIVKNHEDDNEEFYKTSYVVHILKPIYPDKNKSVRANSIEMAQIDYNQKCEAYKKCYFKDVDYTFDISDIVGYKNQD